MSNSVQPHRWHPTRLLCPWDSPGKNTGVGCHFLLQCIKMKSDSEVAQPCLTFGDPMDCSLPGSSTHGIFQASLLEWVAISFSRTFIYVLVNNENFNLMSTKVIKYFHHSLVSAYSFIFPMCICPLKSS